MGGEKGCKTLSRPIAGFGGAHVIPATQGSTNKRMWSRSAWAQKQDFISKITKIKRLVEWFKW
jgi:hypothetical protein